MRMALEEIKDRTYSNLWKGVANRIIAHDRYQTTNKSNKHFKVARDNNKPTRRFQRLYHMPDHHQLNIVDYVAYLHNTGYPIDIAVQNGRTFKINPESSHPGDMNSVNITLQPFFKTGTYNKDEKKGKIAPYAKYHGEYLTHTVFYRLSQHEGSYNSEYGGDNGFDTLSNFMIMLHNNEAHYSRGGLSPKDHLEPSIKDKQTRRWVHKAKMKFFKGYHKMYGSYHTHYAYNQTSFTNLIGNSESTTFNNYTEGDQSYRDNRKYYKEHPRKGNSRGWWNPHYTAYKYLTKKRGISKDIVHSMLISQPPRLRSYSGRVSYSVQKQNKPDLADCLNKVQGVHSVNDYRVGGSGYIQCDYDWKNKSSWKTAKFTSIDDLKKKYPKLAKKALPTKKGNTLKYPNGDVYNLKNHVYFKQNYKYQPMVEFPWVKPVYRTKKLNAVDAYKLMQSHDFVKDQQGKGFTMKDNPNVHINMNSNAKINKNDWRKSTGYKDMTEDVPTGRYKVVGCDRIYLHSDPKSANIRWTKSRWTHDKDGHKKFVPPQVKIYTDTDGRKDLAIHQTGKEIGYHSAHNYGYNFSSGMSRKKDTLYVFEDPIDAISFYNLNRKQLKHENATYLSLGGVGKTKTINAFLKAQHAMPGSYKNVVTCFDNDPAGHRGAEELYASNHDNKAFAEHHDKYTSPVTFTEQHLYTAIPGAHNDHVHHTTRKTLKGEIGRDHDKDYNDVLQCYHNKGVYRGKVPKKDAINLGKHSQAIVTGDQLGNMVVDDAMRACSPQDQRKMCQFLVHYKGYADSVGRHENMYRRKAHLRQLNYDYKRMSKNGQKQLVDMMDSDVGNGGSNNAPKDLIRYATHYGNHPYRGLGRSIDRPERQQTRTHTHARQTSYNHAHAKASNKQGLNARMHKQFRVIEHGNSKQLKRATSQRVHRPKFTDMDISAINQNVNLASQKHSFASSLVSSFTNGVKHHASGYNWIQSSVSSSASRSASFKPRFTPKHNTHLKQSSGPTLE